MLPAAASGARPALGAGASARVEACVLAGDLPGFPAGSEVALKRFHPRADGTPEPAWERECDLLGRLRHPALLPILAKGIDAEGPWLLQPLLAGSTLDAQLALGGMDELRLRALATRIAGALATLHASGYVHGDMKPENIRFDGQGQAYLLDMGFAAPVGAPFSERGTPGYLPPEYLTGAAWSEAGDVFALGVTLYAAATGEHPVPAALMLPGHSAVIESFSRHDARRPSRRAAGLSPAMDQWLARALDPDPKRRPTAAAAVREFQSPPPWAMDGGSPGRRKNPWSRALRTPFAGRARELTWIGDHGRASLQRGTARLLFVQAGPGIGASRLVSEAARRARREPGFPTVLSARVTAYQEERPGHALRSMVRAWLALPPHAAPRPADLENLQRIMPPAEAQAVVQALSPDPGASSGLAEPRALVAFFRRLAEQGPLWILLDEADYAGRSTLEPLERLAQEAPHLPLMLVLTVDLVSQERSQRALESLRDTWRLHASVHTLQLGPLTQQDLLDFVRETFVSGPGTRALAQVLWQRTEGHPGRLRELLRLLESREQLVRRGLNGNCASTRRRSPCPPARPKPCRSATAPCRPPNGAIWCVSRSPAATCKPIYSRAPSIAPQATSKCRSPHSCARVGSNAVPRVCASAVPRCAAALARDSPERRRRLHAELARPSIKYPAAPGPSARGSSRPGTCAKPRTTPGSCDACRV
ncbi:MAG: protein kinase [Planctomycetota bacterium]